MAAEQRPEAGERAADVVRIGTPHQVTAHVVEEIGDLLAPRPRLDGRLGDRRIGRPDQHPIVPGDREQDAAVVGARDQQGSSRRGGTSDRGRRASPGWASAGARTAVPGSSSRRIASAKTPVALMTTRAAIVSSSPVSSSRAATAAIRPPRRVKPVTGAWFSAVPPRSAKVRARADRQPGVVELPVGVDDPPAQPVGDDRRDPLDDLGRPGSAATRRGWIGRPGRRRASGRSRRTAGPAIDRPARRIPGGGPGAGRCGTARPARGAPRGPGGYPPGPGSARRRGSAWCSGSRSPGRSRGPPGAPSDSRARRRPRRRPARWPRRRRSRRPRSPRRAAGPDSRACQRSHRPILLHTVDRAARNRPAGRPTEDCSLRPATLACNVGRSATDAWHESPGFGH